MNSVFHFTKRKIVSISIASLLLIIIFDGTPLGSGFTDKIFYSLYAFFIENRLMCINSIKKYNDAFLEHSIKFETRNIPYFNSDYDAAALREKAAERIYKRICMLEKN